MSHFAIAGLQLSASCGDSLERMGREIRRCKQRYPWLDMLILGELCSYGAEKKYAEEFPGRAETFYCELAKELNVWLIPGSHYERSDDKLFNTASVINNQGEIVCRYRKLFPFCPYETDVQAGDDFVEFNVPQGRIGIAICYDLWFPEVARSLVCEGAEVLIYPTMTGTIDRDVELALARATAATNQCYVIAVNVAGELGNGQSIFVGPEGNCIYQAGQIEEFIPIDIDFATVRRNRERGLHHLVQPLKSFRDKRLDYPAYRLDKPLAELEKLGPLLMPSKTPNT